MHRVAEEEVHWTGAPINLPLHDMGLLWPARDTAMDYTKHIRYFGDYSESLTSSVKLSTGGSERHVTSSDAIIGPHDNWIM